MVSGVFQQRFLCGAGSVRLDFGLTSPHRPSLAPVSSYGNLSVFNPRQDHLDSAGRDQGVASTSRPLGTRFKNRYNPLALANGRERICVVQSLGMHQRVLFLNIFGILCASQFTDHPGSACTKQ